MSESVSFVAGEGVYPEQHHGEFQQQQTTPDVISSAEAPSMWAGWKNRGSNQCGPMIPSELWRNDKYSQPHTSCYVHTNTQAHTHFHTCFACPCWLTTQDLIIPVNHKLHELTHCRGTHTCIHHWPSAYSTHTQTHAHTYSYKCSPNSTLSHGLSLQLCTGCYEIGTVAET